MPGGYGTGAAASAGGGGGRRVRRSVLFCPGSRPDRFAKALASGADSVCLDLEDGVAPGDKEAARDAIVAFLAERGREPVSGGGEGPEIVVRINDPAAEPGRRDLTALAGAPLPDALMIPKVEGPDTLLGALRVLVEALGPRIAAEGELPIPRLLPLIETAAGLHRVEEIAVAKLPLGAFVFGGMDLSAELGARFEWEPLLYARSRVVHAAALAGVGAIDVPWAPLDDPEGLEAETRRAARLGYTGKLAIHPAQVAVIHRGLAPDAEELEAARRIVEASRAAAGGVAVVDGRMVDRPLVLGAERILARAGEAP